ncbi:peroxidase-like [Diabrotica undecimpunctata]|uniref:peroxidase-like n=1 Tax=Diabrotica undecimpunctata TaxID=50387 RepID=UPI003B632B68
MKQATDLLLFCILVFYNTLYKEAAAQVCGVVPSFCPIETNVYRTFTGECNNQIYPWYGTIYSEYDNTTQLNDGFGPQSMPRAKSGNELPNAREVRETCLPDDLQFQQEPYTTRSINGFAQFVAHDMSSAFFANDDFFVCCTDDMQTLPNPPDYCINILLPPNDPETVECGMTCMPVVKTLTNFDRGCDLSSPYAKKITKSTAFLDLNIVYGSSIEESNSLRVPNSYLLITESYNGYPFPPNDPTNSLCPYSTQTTCFRGGDSRLNQNPDLTIQHILWLRFHNYLATSLKIINPRWPNEKIFQEARKINIGVYQWLIYDEVLPEVLGKFNMYENDLIFETFYYLYVDDYDPYCSPNILNEFATAAFKVFHPYIKGQLGLYDDCRNHISSVPLRDTLFRPKITKEQFQPLLMGSVTERAHKLGPEYDPEVTNRLFLRLLQCGLDLVAVDIQRSRDHLVPTYNNLRVHCGLPRATTFSDLLDVMSDANIAKLSSLYESVDDIDGIVGIHLENFKSGAKVGPTGFCIITEQFLRLRRCDRLFFEHPGVFTNFQLAEIRKTTFAGLICLMSNDIDTMQVDALQPPEGLYSPIPCAFIYQMNLNYWIDPQAQQL